MEKACLYRRESWKIDVPSIFRWTPAECCEQVLFTTRFDQNSNKKRHRTKILWYICSKWHKGERSEQFLWDNMYVKQQGNDLMTNPWCNEQQNAQMLQGELKCKQVYARTWKTRYEARLTGKLNWRAEGSRPESIKSESTKSKAPGGTRLTGDYETEPSSQHWLKKWVVLGCDAHSGWQDKFRMHRQLRNAPEQSRTKAIISKLRN